MLKFTNPGLIDLDAVRTMGVSVKNPGSFGFFGTGLKFAIATILRGGGSITIYRGTDAHPLAAEEKVIRGETFKIVTLDGEPMGITTQLGRNWEPWMVLRELGCNAKDEGGEFALMDDGFDPAVHTAVLADDHTTIVVDWAELDAAYRQRGDLFVEGEPLVVTDSLRILAGPSAHVFYRGVRVYKLDKPSLYKYDILADQVLTEDRTLYGMHNVDQLIRDAMLALDDATIIRPVISATDGYHEAKLSYESWSTKPSRTFLDTAIEVRAARQKLNQSARDLLMKNMRDTADGETVTSSTSYRRVRADGFSYAIETLVGVGIVFEDEQQFVTVDELPGNALSIVEKGRVYLLRDLIDGPARPVAEQLIARWIDLKGSIYSPEDAINILAPLLLQTTNLKVDEKLAEEDVAIAAGTDVADELADDAIEIEVEAPPPAVPLS
jgi:hypothetical protein